MTPTTANWRRSKTTRLLLIVLLILIAGFLAYMYEKTRWIMIGALVILFTALGLEVSNTDFDLGKLWETGSLSASKIVRTEEGNLVIGATCENNEFNCDDFANHAEAQEVFDSCGWTGDDVHGLDRDKDGVPCEGLLPASAQ